MHALEAPISQRMRLVFFERRDGSEFVEPIRVRARDDDDRDIGDERIGPLTRSERPAVHHGHAQIENDDRDAEACAEAGERLLAVARFDDVESFES